MKRKIALIIALTCVLLCLASCSLLPSLNPSQGQEIVYDKLNELTEKPCDETRITVTTGEEENQLTSVYVVKQTEIVYRVERFAELSTSGTIPERRILVQSGVATVKDGKVTSISGEPVELPTETELTGRNFHFNESDFTDVKDSSGKFTAKAQNPAAWLGTDKDVENLTVEVEYTDSAITGIKLSYTLFGIPVNVEYLFS